MILLSGSQFSIVPCLYSETTDFPPPRVPFENQVISFPPVPLPEKKKLKIFRLIKLCLVPWDIWPSVNRGEFQWFLPLL